MCREVEPQDNEVQKQWPAIYTGSLLFYPGLRLHEQPAQPETSSTAKESAQDTTVTLSVFWGFYSPIAWSNGPNAQWLLELVFRLS